MQKYDKFITILLGKILFLEGYFLFLIGVFPPHALNLSEKLFDCTHPVVWLYWIRPSIILPLSFDLTKTPSPRQLVKSKGAVGFSRDKGSDNPHMRLASSERKVLIIPQCPALFTALVSLQSSAAKLNKAQIFWKISPIQGKTLPLHPQTALVAKLVDAPDLGSGVLRRAGSSPVRRTHLLGITNWYSHH